MFRRFGSYCPAMAMNDALDGREPYPGAFELVSPMQPLKDTEQLVGILHVETDTVVPHEDL
jgi:hypothetical protein